MCLFILTKIVVLVKKNKGVKKFSFSSEKVVLRIKKFKHSFEIAEKTAEYEKFPVLNVLNLTKQVSLPLKKW